MQKEIDRHLNLAPAATITLKDGKFQKTYEYGDPMGSVIAVRMNPAKMAFPLTIECWAMLTGTDEFNTLLAFGEKGSPDSWELLIPRWSRGDVGVYSVGRSPELVLAPKKKLNDHAWHYVAAVLEEKQLTLYVDGEQVSQTPWRPVAPARTVLPEEMPLLIGTDGLHASVASMDELRISRGVRPIGTVPSHPFQTDEQTIGLWHFDTLENGDTFADTSSNRLPAKIIPLPKISLNEIEHRQFHPGPSPLASPAEEVKLEPCHPAGRDPHEVEVEGRRNSEYRLLLDGQWRMAEGGEEKDRLTGNWADAIAARVPGGTAWALFEAGRMADPTVGKNMAIAFERGGNDFWYERAFDAPKAVHQPRLVIGGVCEEYSVWLNGQPLGSHQGKYIRREFPVSALKEKNNRLVIKVNGLKRKKAIDPFLQYGPTDDKSDIDIPSTQGWHYAACPPQGIWRSVWLSGTAPVRIENPFIATREAVGGRVDLALDLQGAAPGIKGTLSVFVTPENFSGTPCRFIKAISQESTNASLHYKFSIPDPHPWWPVGLGHPNLYRLTLRFEPEGGGEPHQREVVFGLRTVETRPLPEGASPVKYNWQFVINGRDIFLKGANWCWNDCYLNMPREKYERFIGLARRQNVQVLRAWGAGILETENFYDVCDRNGVMVLQEFPGSGPLPIVESSWRQFILDHRNHPALIWYGGGNEIDFPYGGMFTMLGRLACELDGTRPFHRTDPFGGSAHDYGVYWGNSSFDWNLQLARRWPFIGEFGFTSMPNLESVLKYLPADEKNLWPAPADGSFAFHTPAFNRDAGYGRDISHIDHYVKMFLPCEGMSNCASMADYIFASQVAQVTALRYPLEIMRTRWPQATGVCYYKLTDVYPAASYSSIDWYGVPKLAHYFLADAYATLLASATFKTLHPKTPEQLAEVFVLDDGNRLAGKHWRALVRAFDGATLREIGRQSWDGKDGVEKVKKLGDFSLPAGTAVPTPLFVVTDITVDDVPAKRTFYWLNFDSQPDCLRKSPATTLQMERLGQTVMVRNTGNVPAIAVNFIAPSVSDRFLSDDNFFWLDPGESRQIKVNMTDGLEGVTAWNLKPPESQKPSGD